MALDFFARGEIDDREPVKAGQLGEDKLGGTIGIGRDGHGTNAQVHGDGEGDLVGLRVDHADHFSLNRTGEHVLAVGGDVGVVDGVVRGNERDFFLGNRIDHVDAAILAYDGDIHAPPIMANGDVVGVSMQTNPIDHLEAFAVGDVQGLVGFVADINPFSIRVDGNPVVELDPLDMADDLIGDGVDDADAVSREVRLNDARLQFRRGHSGYGEGAQRDAGASREGGAEELLPDDSNHCQFLRHGTHFNLIHLTDSDPSNQCF